MITPNGELKLKIKRLWMNSYRPTSIDQYVFQNDNHKTILNRFIKDKEIPNLFLTGTQGSGKTTIAEILINELDVDEFDVLRVNASDKTGIDYIREQIISFAEGASMGRMKIIKLEEIDFLSPNAQGMLRQVMENNTDTCRFICLCNYENKVMPALKSRMQHLRFKAPPKDDVLIRMGEILIAEEIEFKSEAKRS